MEKTIYCKNEERCKKIKFCKVNEKMSDSECVTQKIREACENDLLLKKKIENQAIVLQKLIQNQNILCDIEAEEEIIDELEITCIVPLGESLLSCSTIYAIDQDGSLIETQEKISECVEEKEKENQSINSQFKKLKTNDFTEKRSIISSFVGTPTSLPELTPELVQKVNNGGMLLAQKSLTYFWATDLLHRTNGMLSKNDYFNYAKAIVSAYPELSGGDHGCGIVRHQSSTNVRNRRANSERSVMKFGEDKLKIGQNIPTVLRFIKSVLMYME
ncbi:uncharacterized protein [Venturia canescens]|uniref:uncharacterized protein n=1 Tax=Venturia canescens TaxID=32260 RepID=UPI001C9CFAA2|nr:uncharacterized protein LOC122406047 [Venturia canescens]XP_043267156.1 uncharacterized protein LOC122406047 [Venturia canescens]XP_043268119.1 uncharacterized protein LOC122406622 [Venturia canescens]XP_043268121.1 uncharacterized protein LOC122406622 [Venturia canescens]XP_043268858.1 uncharacterized protein LOC122407000 [Venturia canescens]XP_043268859.1 uncharacterized protein LOC122407000 [Venturia canescens]XP_043270473.1 uncharacterized protein LOC122408016 [Venturia canescens]XP_0